MTRVEQWLEAVLNHEPGTTDEAAQRVASWSARDIRMLWIDANVTVQLIRDPRKSGVSVQAENQRRSQPIRYSTLQLARMKVLACAAAGSLSHPACVEIRAAGALDPDLVRLSTLAAAARRQGDDNFVLRRGALLHADIAMLLPGSVEPISEGALDGPRRVRIQTSDGMALDYREFAPHWEVARMLLDAVRPAGAAKPAPGLDDMVRLWYRSTAAWMQAREEHDSDHSIARARSSRTTRTSCFSARASARRTPERRCRARCERCRCRPGCGWRWARSAQNFTTPKASFAAPSPRTRRWLRLASAMGASCSCSTGQPMRSANCGKRWRRATRPSSVTTGSCSLEPPRRRAGTSTPRATHTAGRPGSFPRRNPHGSP